MVTTNLVLYQLQSPAANCAAGTGPAGSGQNFPQTFESLLQH